MDLNRIFYANGLGFTFSADEAVLIFRLRPIEQPLQSPERAAEAGEEVARVHMPRSLAHTLMTTIAQQYQEKASNVDVQVSQERTDVPKS